MNQIEGTHLLVVSAALVVFVSIVLPGQAELLPLLVIGGICLLAIACTMLSLILYWSQSEAMEKSRWRNSAKAEWSKVANETCINAAIDHAFETGLWRYYEPHELQWWEVYVEAD